MRAVLIAARNGNKEAQGQLLEACRRPLLRLARRQLSPGLSPKGAGSDVVQETFLQALREINTFRGCTPEQMMAWLRVILEHTMSNFRRRFHTGKREVGREVSGEMATVREDPRHAVPSASEKAISNEQARLMLHALERLPEHYREVVRLRREERLSFEEIGRRTGRTADAARKVWLRALAEVGQYLAEVGAPPKRDLLRSEDRRERTS